MAQAAESEPDDDETIEIPDPEDDDGTGLNDLANLYAFQNWWIAGQNPISLTELEAMPETKWADFKTLLGKYSQYKKIVKSQKKFGKKGKKDGLFNG